VIAADIGGLGEVVADAGLRFAPGDSEALYICLREVIENPARRRALGLAARRRAVRAFGRDSMIEGHVAAYREALGS
jgi:polysaccharide biosynthesis protein PelF